MERVGSGREWARLEAAPPEVGREGCPGPRGGASTPCEPNGRGRAARSESSPHRTGGGGKQASGRAARAPTRGRGRQAHRIFSLCTFHFSLVTAPGRAPRDIAQVERFTRGGAHGGCTGWGGGVDLHGESPCPISIQNCLPRQDRAVLSAWTLPTGDRAGRRGPARRRRGAEAGALADGAMMVRGCARVRGGGDKRFRPEGRGRRMRDERIL